MREGLWDRARGIGIILVVYGHVLRGLVAAGLVDKHSWLLFSDFAIYTFHMPLFFLLAGMNAARGVRRPDFITSKIPSIVYPYLLWSLLQGGVQLLADHGANDPVTVGALLSILWAPVFQFWFLYAIFVCHLIARLSAAEPMRLVLFALAAYPVGIYLLASVPVLANPFSMLVFYTAGLFLNGHLKELVVKLSDPSGVLATAIALAVAVFAASRMGSYHAPSALAAAFLGILLTLQLSSWLPAAGPLRVIELLGLASMPIYLVHVFGTAGVRIVLMKLHIVNVPLHLAAGVLAGLLVPLAALYLAYRLRWEKFAGFSAGAPVFAPLPPAVPAAAAPVSLGERHGR